MDRLDLTKWRTKLRTSTNRRWLLRQNCQPLQAELNVRRWSALRRRLRPPMVPLAATNLALALPVVGLNPIFVAVVVDTLHELATLFDQIFEIFDNVFSQLPRILVGLGHCAAGCCTLASALLRILPCP